MSLARMSGTNQAIRKYKSSCTAMIFLAVAVAGGLTARQESLPDAPSATKTKMSTVSGAGASEHEWPRTFTSGTDHFTLYQPQVESWQENIVSLYCAVEAKREKDKSPKYGVVWLHARTEVDKVNRLVTLDQVKVTKVKFPSAPDRESTLLDLLQKRVPGATKTIALDRLQSAVEINKEIIKTIAVKNDPPKVIISSQPSLLVLVDGTTQMRQVPGTKVQRVINSKSTILFDAEEGFYYLRVENRWLRTEKVEGPWNHVDRLPGDIKTAEKVLERQAPADIAEPKESRELATLQEPSNQP
jgi:hypothetical protein